VVDNLMCDRVQQARRRLRLQSRDQQLRQTPFVQADRVREWSLFTLDKLNYPSVVRDGVPQTVEVLVDGAVRVVALPAHVPNLSVVVTNNPALTHRHMRPVCRRWHQPKAKPAPIADPWSATPGLSYRSVRRRAHRQGE